MVDIDDVNTLRSSAGLADERAIAIAISAPASRAAVRPFGSTSTTTPRSGVTPIDSKACSIASAARGPVQIESNRSTMPARSSARSAPSPA